MTLQVHRNYLYLPLSNIVSYSNYIYITTDVPNIAYQLWFSELFNDTTNIL